MATERQIAANRANACKSTGPRSRAGKKRAAGNATQHGLTPSFVSSAGQVQKIETLARHIAGSANTDEILLQYARDAASSSSLLATNPLLRQGAIKRCGK